MRHRAHRDMQGNTDIRIDLPAGTRLPGTAIVGPLRCSDVLVKIEALPSRARLLEMRSRRGHPIERGTAQRFKEKSALEEIAL